jgi:pilus assembly protein Flp/PilA
MHVLLKRLLADEAGATAIEYGMIMGLMFLVILGALTAFADTSTGIFNVAMNKLRVAMGG